MSFESRVVAFSARFLSSANFELIVAPALADLQFEEARRPAQRVNRLAVLRAVGRRHARRYRARLRGLVALTLVSAGYYFVLSPSASIFSRDRDRMFSVAGRRPAAGDVAGAGDGLLLAGTPRPRPTE